MGESVLAIVTGASKGLGKAIARVLCCIAPQSLIQVDRMCLILVARSPDLLEENGRNIRQMSESLNVRMDVFCHAVDLSDLEGLNNNIDEIFKGVDVSLFDRAIFFNNAGSIGFLGPCHESPSIADMKRSIDLNVTSSLWLSSYFAKLMQDSQKNTTATLVNISSLLAVEAFPTMGIYSAGKAARDQYHATMAKEVPEETLKILNYAPGPLETDMVTQIRNAPQLHETLKPSFAKNLIDPVDSALKLIKLVISGDYQSGAHLDYYDLPDNSERHERS